MKNVKKERVQFVTNCTDHILGLGATEKQHPFEVPWRGFVLGDLEITVPDQKKQDTIFHAFIRKGGKKNNYWDNRGSTEAIEGFKKHLEELMK